ncbi:hypothetical protein Pelo_9897 [Pelomyxa schiedti]|nr:hypothetical protein Pelo_9897 [Pelomyxa schiedti]
MATRDTAAAVATPTATSGGPAPTIVVQGPLLVRRTGAATRTAAKLVDAAAKLGAASSLSASAARREPNPRRWKRCYGAVMQIGAGGGGGGATPTIGSQQAPMQLLLFDGQTAEAVGGRPPFDAFDVSAASVVEPRNGTGLRWDSFEVCVSGRSRILAAANGEPKSKWLSVIGNTRRVDATPSVGPLSQRNETNTAIDLQLSGRKLPKMDMGPFRKSDPFFLLSTDYGRVLHRSEVIRQTLDPDWAPFRLWLHQSGGPGGALKIDCFDWDKDGGHDYMGFTSFEVRSLLEKNKTLSLPHKNSTLKVVSAQQQNAPIPPEPLAYIFRCAAKHLDKKDGPLGKSDPFFTINVAGYTIYKSEIVSKSLDCTWHDFTLDIREIPGMTGWESPTRITVYDFDLDGDWEEIGHFDTTLSLLKFPGFPYPVRLDRKVKNVGYNNSGYFTVVSCQVGIPQDNMFAADPVSFSLKFRASGLRRDMIARRPDPFFVISTRLATIYRSPVCKSTTSPDWPQFSLPSSLWDCSARELLMIDVYDWDADGSHSLIGTTTFDTWTLRRFPNLNFPIYAGSNIVGNFICDSIVAETTYTPPYNTSTVAFQIKATGKKLSIPGSLERADPFFEVRRDNLLLYRSEHLVNTNSPNWDSFTINIAQIGGINEPFELSVWDWEKKGDHRLIGKYFTTLNELLAGPFQYPLLPASKCSSSGSLVVKYNIPDSNGVFHVASVEPGVERAALASASALEINCGCENLVRSLGLVGSCDAFFTVAVDTPTGLSKVYKSEVVMGNLNPKFKPFQIPLDKGFDAKLAIQVYDYNKDGDHEYYGQVTCTPREFTFSWFSSAIKKSGGTSGSFIVSGYTIIDDLHRVKLTVPPALKMKCYARKLPIKDVSTMSIDPFFVMKKNNVTLYRSEVYPKTFSPSWAECIVPLDMFTAPQDTFIIEVFDYDKDGTHDSIGIVSVSLSELQWSWFEEAIRAGTSTNGSFGIKDIVPCEAPALVRLKGLQLSTSISKLERADNPLLKTDAFFEVWVQANIDGRQSDLKIYKSGIVMQSLAPVFEPFILRSFFRLTKKKDADGSHDMMGSFSMVARDLTFSWFSSGIYKPSGESAGSFNIDKVVPLLDLTFPSDTLPPATRMTCYAKKLPIMDVSTMSCDPFFVIRKFSPTVGKEITIYRSEVLRKTQKPRWDSFYLPLTLLKNPYDTIDVLVYDWDKDGTHDLIGKLNIVWRDLQWSWYEQGLERDGNNQGCFGVESAEAIAPLDVPPTPAGLRVFCSAAKLARMDGPLASSDPFFVIKARPPGFRGEITLYRSEVVYKKLAPQWNPFDLSVEAIGDIDAPFRIQVYDFDRDGGHDVIGELLTTLREWSFGSYQQALYKDSSSMGSFSVDRVEPIGHVTLPTYAPSYRIHASGFKIARLDFGPTGAKPSDPFFTIRATPPGYDKEITVYRSPVVMKADNPVWGYFTLDMSLIGDLDSPFKIEVMDWDADGGHDLVGRCTMTVREWCFGPYRSALINPSKVGLPGYDSSGAFSCDDITPVYEPAEKKIVPIAVEVKTSAQKLTNMDGPISKSDPFFVVSGQPPGFTHPITLYRSEVIMKNLNPDWKPFVLFLEDIGGVDSPFKISVYDWDADGAHEFIGELETTFREWTFGSYQQALINPNLKNCIGYQSSGAFSVDRVFLIPPAEAPQYRRPLPVAFQISPSARKLDRKDISGSSDPFFEIKAEPPGKSKITLYRSEVIMRNLNPCWKPFTLNLSDITNLDTPFTVSIYDWDKDGGHDLIGTAQTIMREWLFSPYSFSVRTSTSSIMSSGAFSVDSVMPLSQQFIKLAPAAYRIKASALKLPRKDVSLSSDPFFEVFVVPPGAEKPILLHRSNVVMKCLEPVWDDFEFNVSMVGGLDSPFTVVVYDWDRDGGHDRIGSLQTTLREWTFGPYQQELLEGGLNQGAFSVDEVTPLSFSQVREIPAAFQISVSADKLPLLTGPTFFELKASPPGSKTAITIYRSEVAKEGGRQPRWDSFSLNVDDVRGIDTLFTIHVWNYHPDGEHKLIGSLHTTLRSWSFGPFREGLTSAILSTDAGAFCIDTVSPLPDRVLKKRFSAYRMFPFGAKLARKDVTASSDPFFEIRTKAPPGCPQKYITVYRSEVISRNLNPTWKPFELSMEVIGDLDSPFDIFVYDFDEDGGHDLIGKSTITMREWTFGEHRIELKAKGAILCQGAFGVSCLEGLEYTQVKPMSPAYLLHTGVAKVTTLLGKTKPFFELWISDSKMLYRSEVCKNYNNSSGTWAPIPINLSDVNGIDSFFTLKVYNRAKDGDHHKVGDCSLTFRDLTFGPFRFALTKKLQVTDSNAAFCVNNVESRPGYIHRFIRNKIPTDEPSPAFSVQCYASKLSRKDVAGKSDPFFKIVATPAGFTHPITLYRSVAMKNDLNPKWAPFELNLADIRGLHTPFSVVVWDWDADGGHDKIGEAEVTLFDFIQNGCTVPLKGPKVGLNSGGFTFCKPELLEREAQRQKSSPAFQLSVSGRKLAAMDIGIHAKSDPFFVITAQPAGFSTPITIYRSEIIPKNLNPSWKAFSINTSDIPFDAPFQISVWDADDDGGHDLIGCSTTTLRELSFGDIQLGLYKPPNILGSRGCFSVDSIQALPSEVRPSIAEAYCFTFSGAKLNCASSISSVSAPFFEVTCCLPREPQAVVMYRSEVGSDSTPHWQPFPLSLREIGGVDNPFTISVFDFRDNGAHAFIGDIKTTIRDCVLFGPYLVGLNDPSTLNMLRPTRPGALLINNSAITVSDLRQYPAALQLSCSGFELENKDAGGLIKSDPFFEIRRLNKILLYRSEVISKNDCPSWKDFTLSLQLAGGLDVPVELSCYDWDSDGHHDLIGSFITTFRDLCLGSFTRALKNTNKILSVGYKSSGGFKFAIVTVAQYIEEPISALGITVHPSAVKLHFPITRAKVPFFEVRVKGDNKAKQLLYRSELCKGDNIAWAPLTLSFSDVKGMDGQFTIWVWNFSDKGDHDLIGKLKTTLREWSFACPFSTRLVNKNHQHRVPGYTSSGAFVVNNVSPINTTCSRTLPMAIQVHPAGCSLSKSGLIQKRSTPFFEILAPITGQEGYALVYRSKVYNVEIDADEVNPSWEPFELSPDRVAGWDTPFIVNCYNWDKDGTHDLIGRFTSTMREWLFSPHTECLKPEIPIPLFKSAGGFIVSKSVLLSTATPFILPLGISLNVSGLKIDMDTGLWFEIWLRAPETTQIFLYRSEAISSASPEWRPVNVWPGKLVPSALLARSIFQFRLFGWNEGKHKVENVGKVICSYQELLFGSWTGTVINGRKKKHNPVYFNSGGLKANAAPLPPSMPPDVPATEYVVRFQLDSVPKGSSCYSVCLESVTATGCECILPALRFPALDFVIPFEAVCGLDAQFHMKLSFSTDSRFSKYNTCRLKLPMCLRQLAIPGYRASVKMPRDLITIPNPLNPKPALGTVSVESCVPRTVNIPGYQITLHATDLPRSDTLTGLSDPFLVVRTDKATVFTSEIHTQDLSPTFGAFVVDVAAIGGLDTKLTLAVFDYDPDGEPDFLGDCTVSLRSMILGSSHRLWDKLKAAKFTDYPGSGYIQVAQIVPITTLAPLQEPYCLTRLQ